MKVYYEHLTNNPKINNGRTTIEGTRIEPQHIVNYGTIKEIITDFNLTRDQVIEALHYELSKNMTKEDETSIERDWHLIGEYFEEAMKNIGDIINNKE